MMIKKKIEHVERQVVAPDARTQASTEALPQGFRRENFPEIQTPANDCLSVNPEELLQLRQALFRRCALQQRNDNQ
jgi:hypothetical protein